MESSDHPCRGADGSDHQRHRCVNHGRELKPTENRNTRGTESLVDKLVGDRTRSAARSITAHRDVRRRCPARHCNDCAILRPIRCKTVLPPTGTSWRAAYREIQALRFAGATSVKDNERRNATRLPWDGIDRVPWLSMRRDLI
jgi:hypothetical protein